MWLDRLVIAAALVGCTRLPATGGTGSDGGGSGSDGGLTACAQPATCSAWNVVSRCGVEETCAGGCFAGECRSDACADECGLDEVGPHGTCRLWDLAEKAFVSANPNASLHDRARDYDRMMRLHHLPEGGVAGVIYTDESRTQVESYDGIVDSALWTGTQLAAQSWRHLATRSADSAARIAALASTLHLWFNVSGDPAFLARFAAPEGSTLVPMDCSRRVIHCNAQFEGQQYRWRGDTSRDQYTGWILGVWFAYAATPDETLRAKLRSDVLELIGELMIDRHAVPVRATINGVPIDTTLDSKFVILAPQEMTDGRITMSVDTGDLGDAQMDGAREFVPDAGALLGQLIGFAPSIPRPGSAMMLGAFYAVALRMTEDEPALAARHAAIQADYDAEFERLFAMASQSEYNNSCGAKYYGTHISRIMAYLWTSLERDPMRSARLVNDVMAPMWPEVAAHKNVYYAFLNAGARGGFANEVAAHVAQLAQYEPGPRIHVARNGTSEYPIDNDCGSPSDPYSTVATDVGDRVMDDFMWQRHPWQLVTPRIGTYVHSGNDFLAAYWLGRFHDLLPDDRAGTCTRWEP